MPAYKTFCRAYSSTLIFAILAASTSLGESTTLPGVGRLPVEFGTSRETGAEKRADGFSADRTGPRGGAKNSGVGVVGCMAGCAACSCKWLRFALNIFSTVAKCSGGAARKASLKRFVDREPGDFGPVQHFGIANKESCLRIRDALRSPCL